MHEIRCRMRLEDDCQNGLACNHAPTNAYTYEADSDTVVCDSCFLRLLPFTEMGKITFTDELKQAHTVYKDAVEWVQTCKTLDSLDVHAVNVLITIKYPELAGNAYDRLESIIYIMAREKLHRSVSIELGLDVYD